MATELIRVSRENGLWQNLLKGWNDECEAFGENLDDYATSSMAVIRPLAEETQTPNAGIYALAADDSFMGLCQLNVAFIPGYTDKVLRVRHIVHSPRFDFDDSVSIDDYTKFLSGLLVGVFHISNNDMRAPNIKFHFKSPAERFFFDKIKGAVKDSGIAEMVEMRGAWLYIRKVGE